MAKSIRSKTKRTFRNKKREDSVYAATEAARLHRLNAKLATIATRDCDGDVPVQDIEGEEVILGWSWFSTFGLLDPSDITVESMDTSTRGGIGRILLQDHLIGGDEVSDFSLLICSLSQMGTFIDALKLSTGEATDVSREPADAMSIDTEPTKRISTHGPRGSRREEWRLSKGLEPKPKRNGMNRQGSLVGRRKAGRAKRRR